MTTNNLQGPANSDHENLETKVQKSPRLIDIFAAGAVLMNGFGSLANLAFGRYGIAAIEAGIAVGTFYGHKYYVRRYETNRNIGRSE